MGFFKDLFGPREPCSLCHLGQSSWPSDRSGSADWKIRGEGLHVSLLICLHCRRFLMDSGLMYKPPMLALAQLVSLGAAHRPPLAAYFQDPGWRTIWLHTLEFGGLQPSDEFAALQMIRPIEEEFMKNAGVSDSGQPGSVEEEEPEPTLDAGLRAMMSEYGIPDEVIQRKYMAYAITLRGSGRTSHWNDDVDEHGLSIGAITREEVARAFTDFHQAILNRVKIALVAEGWWPIPLDDGEED